MAVIGGDFTSLVPGFEATDSEESIRTLETFVRRCTYDDSTEPLVRHGLRRDRSAIRLNGAAFPGDDV